MNIFFDGGIFSQQKSGGISKYWAELIKAMASDPDRHFHKIELRLRPKAERNIFLSNLLDCIAESPLVEPKRIVFSFRSIFGKNQIVHSPYMLTPGMFGSSLRVLTIHDLIHKKVSPQNLRAWLRGKILDFSIAWANAYICVSETTRAELHAFYPKTRTRPTRVIYHGIDSEFINREVSLTRDDEQNPYVLFVGQRQGYKNFQLVTQALAESATLGHIQIVCVGGSPFNSKEKSELQKLGIASRVKHVAAPSESELMDLYDHALALTYPSSMEGFGMPILEAMARGCPVICSSQSSMGEIAAGLNYELCLNQPESMTLALAQLLDHGRDQSRIEKAIHHAHTFSWDRAKNQTLAFYDDLLAAKFALSFRK